MTELPIAGLSEGDVRFLIEAVEPRLMSRLDTVKGDRAILEGMLDQEAGILFKRMTQPGDENALAGTSPRLFFEVMLRMAVKELDRQAYTLERSASQKIPVFDASEVVRFLGDKAVLRYLVTMLASFTRTESYTVRTRTGKGIWRKERFSDMDLHSLARLCEATDEEHRFAVYKRIADLCLFVLGMFPESLPSDLLSGQAVEAPKRFARSAEDYEEEGRRFYKLAGQHREARSLEMGDVLYRLHEKFNLAKKPLNYISENFIQFRKHKLFPPAASN